MITSFRGNTAFLSNFYRCDITYGGKTYLSTEAAFQASKCQSETEKTAFTSVGPTQAKYMGRKVNCRPDWDSVKNGIMLDVLRIKFADQDLARWLCSTMPHELVEGNTWGDRYWGQCNGIGQNVLGELLMQVRSELL